MRSTDFLIKHIQNYIRGTKGISGQPRIYVTWQSRIYMYMYVTWQPRINVYVTWQPQIYRNKYGIYHGKAILQLSRAGVGVVHNGYTMGHQQFTGPTQVVPQIHLATQGSNLDHILTEEIIAFRCEFLTDFRLKIIVFIPANLVVKTHTYD